MHEQTPMLWLTTLSAKKLCFHFYSEAPLLNGTKATSKLLHHRLISDRGFLLDLQMDEIKFAIDWKLNTVIEEMEKKFEIFSIESKKTVNKGWSDDMSCIPNAQQTAQRVAQG